MANVSPSTNINNAGLPLVTGSTLHILRTLYTSLIPANSSTLPASTTNTLLHLDAQTAMTHHSLPSINILSTTTSLMDESISKLPKDKSALRDGFLRHNNDIQSEIANLNVELQEKISPLYNEITESHHTIRTLIAKSTSPESKEQLAQAIEQLKSKARAYQQAASTYKAKYETIKITQLGLRHEVSKNVPISEEKPSITPKLS